MRNAMWLLGELGVIAQGWVLCRLGRHFPVYLGDVGSWQLHYCSRCDVVVLE